MLKIFLLAALLFTFGCLSSHSGLTLSSEQRAISSCINACLALKESGADMDRGPCAADPLPNYPLWVCDVAHNPRQPVDDIISNQCSVYRNGEASWFIEVTPGCEYIRSS